MKKLKRKFGGFTIVEVVLVLAIAGLIFMMMFIALPTLQRTQRDARRRDDMIALAGAIKKYQSNHRGALPTNKGEWGSILNDYLNDPKDPDGNPYIINGCGTDARNDAECMKECDGSVVGSECKISESDASPAERQAVTIIRGATCEGEKVKVSSNPRKVAILYDLELGTYCGST